MEMSGSHFIPATQDRVWAALNDPKLLKACIAGCELFEAAEENSYKLLMSVRIGPVRARFSGKMHLSDLNPPNAYALGFEGQGGVAGFAKGKSDVTLTPEGEGTRLAYTAHAQIGGKLAQIGSRLIDGAAKKMADDFFSAFVEKLGAAPMPDAAPTGIFAQRGTEASQ